ncbi:MAG: PQQ-dependent sugar dehydrogenase [Anaerolineales bacterium]|nr:PQQ-dependent sugar dehydrogenase [Anaerolineales bacterium]
MEKRNVGMGLALASALGLALTLAVLATPARAGPPTPIDWTQYAVGFTQPIDIAFTGVATDTRMFVVQRDGQIKIALSNGSVLTDSFLDIGDIVDSESTGERGLYGMAFDPDYANNGSFYVDYIDLDDNIQLSRFQVSADPNVALTTEVKLLTIPISVTSQHNGGNLDFGPDGYLYMAPGDGGIRVYGQWTDRLLGKMLRLDVSGQPTYTVPATNPFTQTAGVLPEIWAIGLRNPWRFSFDQLTGDLYIGDVGEGSWEEVDRQPAASPGGENFGWGCYEGTHVMHLDLNCPDLADTTLPFYEYDRSVGHSVIGGYVYRGAAYSYLQGYYFFADFISRRFFAYNTTTHNVLNLGQFFGLGWMPVTFGQDAAGEMYVADWVSGTVYKLVGMGPLEHLFSMPLISR